MISLSRLKEMAEEEMENKIKDLELALKAKEQECEELKKKCNIYTCGICGNKEDCNKLYKTLTEIKEIIKFNKANRLSGGADISIEQILQKISEVLE